MKKKYIIIQLCDGMSQEQCQLVSETLNDGYFILSEYRFSNTVTLILKLEENDANS